MKRIPFWPVFLLALLLSACGRPAENNDHTMNGMIRESPSPAATTSPVAGSPLVSEAPPSASPETATEEPTPKLYRMNDAFRFEPLSKETTNKAVLLTFDDGPINKDILLSLLDTLDKHEAKAIFFVNGYRVKQNPDLLKLIHERGQTIGNHSWDHINLKNESEQSVEQQIGDLQTEIESLTGEKPKFFRPPYGSGGDLVRNTAKNHGMLYMTWSNGSLDWDKSTKDKPAEVIRNVLEQLHPGANILMHELRWTADALDELLTKLEEKGYSFIDPAAIETNR
ncbi:polysaccharide deacetylase family protein [Paenibacillus harenae]|uniref:polysaccharide deacetylase family protein n=1 Tax=Paenibacillus harenae TaxID=306543 RepID=UPI0009FD6FE8|nr:polysaccharide deacetylase family protein [Paenibacillus harenae]